jgi:hypothetical protein
MQITLAKIFALAVRFFSAVKKTQPDYQTGETK